VGRYLIARVININNTTEFTMKGRVYPPKLNKKEPSINPSILPMLNPNCKYPVIFTYPSSKMAGTIE